MATVAATAEKTQSVSGEEFLERAKKLKPVLSERVPEANELRRVPEKTIEDFQNAGFFKMLQPSLWGGYELDPKTFFMIQLELASACPSSGWVMGVLAVHPWQMGLFPPEACEDVWGGGDNSVLVASSYAPMGKVKHVDGGYQLSGKWSFSSGIDHCGWVFLGALIFPEKGKGAPDYRTFLVPKKDFKIEDDWYVTGLKASGSKSVIVDDAFVPEHRTHRGQDGFSTKNPGNAAHKSWIYKHPFAQVFTPSVSTPALGAAFGAVDAFSDWNKKRVYATAGTKASENVVNQSLMGESKAEVEALKTKLWQNLKDCEDAIHAGKELSLATRAQFRFEYSRMAAKSCEVAQKLMVNSGGQALKIGNPINNFFQDVHAIRAHVANNPHPVAANLGGINFGLENKETML